MTYHFIVVRALIPSKACTVASVIEFPPLKNIQQADWKLNSGFLGAFSYSYSDSWILTPDSLKTIVSVSAAVEFPPP